MGKRSSHQKVRKALRLYGITSRHWLGSRSFEELITEALEGGATCIQLREKKAPYQEKKALACTAQRLCRRYDVPFLIDDDVELALEIDADGVHLGQKDMACSRAREILGEEKIIGVSAKTVEQARKAQADGADYVGVGAVFPTSTKDDTSVLPAGRLHEITQSISIPVVAIGGITEENIGKLASSGIDGIAVISALFSKSSVYDAARILNQKLSWLDSSAS